MVYRLKIAVFCRLRHHGRKGGAEVAQTLASFGNMTSSTPETRRNALRHLGLNVAQRWRKVAQKRGRCATLNPPSYRGGGFREVAHVPGPFSGWRI